MCVIQDVHFLVGMMMCTYNFFMCVFGIILCAIGVAMRSQTYESLFKDLFRRAVRVSSQANLDTLKYLPNDYKDVTLDTYDTLLVSNRISQYFIILGVFFLVAMLLSFIIGPRSGIYMVLFYAVFVCSLTAALIAAYVDGKSFIIEDMEESLDSYTGLNDRSSIGKTWNVLMHGLGCCGVKSYKDFKDKKSWPPKILRGYKLNHTSLPNKLFGTCKKLKSANGYDCGWFNPEKFKTPMACCKSFSNISQGCHLKGNASDLNNWMNTGCSTKIFEYLDDKHTVPALFYILVFVMVTFCFIIVFRLIIGEDDSVDDSPGATFVSYHHCTWLIYLFATTIQKGLTEYYDVDIEQSGKK